MATDAVDKRARTPLNRGQVVRAGIELADQQGLAALSMRRLSAHLGFEVMALYNHVANKRDLLEAMLEQIATEIELPAADERDWKTGLRNLAIAQHDLLLRHRWAGPISTDHFPGVHRWGIMEATLRLLTTGGFDGHLRDLGFHAITLHIGGFTAQRIAFDFDDQFTREMNARVERELSADEHPLMVEHMRYHRDAEHLSGERPDEFRFVLDLILDGLERRRDTAAASGGNT